MQLKPTVCVDLRSALQSESLAKLLCEFVELLKVIEVDVRVSELQLSRPVFVCHLLVHVLIGHNSYKTCRCSGANGYVLSVG